MSEELIQLFFDNAQAELERARTIAIRLIEERAKEIMREDEDLVSFALGMGSYAFTDKDGDMYGGEGYSWYASIDRLLDKWDIELQLTGEGLFIERGDL